MNIYTDRWKRNINQIIIIAFLFPLKFCSCKWSIHSGKVHIGYRSILIVTIKNYIENNGNVWREIGVWIMIGPEMIWYVIIDFLFSFPYFLWLGFQSGSCRPTCCLCKAQVGRESRWTGTDATSACISDCTSNNVARRYHSLGDSLSTEVN